MMENPINTKLLKNIEQIQIDNNKKIKLMKQMHFIQNKKDYYNKHQIKKLLRKLRKKLNGKIGLMKIEGEKERNIIIYFEYIIYEFIFYFII